MTSNVQVQIMQYDNLSSAEFASLVQNNRPCIVKKATTQWTAFKKWSPHYFQEKYPDKKVDMQVTYFEPLGKFRYDTKRLTMPEAISHMCNNNDANVKYYLAHQSITNDFTELQQDIGKFDFTSNDKKYDLNFWFGEAGNKTPLHFDYPQNLHTQIRGKKYIQLYDPAQNYCLYPPTYEKGRERYHVSQVINPDEPDPEKFPMFRTAIPHVGVLEPGDVIYIPSGWWHFIKSTELSISVNLWWKPSYKECNISHILRNVANIMFDRREFKKIWDIFQHDDNANKLEVAEYLADKGELWLSTIFAAEHMIEILQSASSESTSAEQQISIEDSQNKMLSIQHLYKIKGEEINQWYDSIKKAKFEKDELIDLNQLSKMISYFKTFGARIQVS